MVADDANVPRPRAWILGTGGGGGGPIIESRGSESCESRDANCCRWAESPLLTFLDFGEWFFLEGSESCT